MLKYFKSEHTGQRSITLKCRFFTFFLAFPTVYKWDTHTSIIIHGAHLDIYHKKGGTNG